jgi:SAM-dependent methyltransferase
MKTYDRKYFHRWYRDPDDRVVTRSSLERKVRFAVGIAEFLLERPVATVLDIGCGEAPWLGVLRRMRPAIRYVGVDPSDYVLARFGASRHIRRGTFGGLGRVSPPLPKRIDLIVCADVLQYVDIRDVERGLRAIRRLLGGVAYIEAYTTADFMEGDRVDWHERTAAEYRRVFRRVGLTQCGPYCYVNLDALDTLNVFEHM